MGERIMAALGGNEISARLTHSNLRERLIVGPLLVPAEQLRSDQASIDIRLGFEFALVSPSVRGSIDEFSDEKLSRLSTDLYRKEYVPLGGSLIIHPHQFILAATLEYIRLPFDLMSYVIGRSTWGRLGLIVATAVGIQPGFAGTLTLELRNLGETPLTLYPGQAIGQLFFHTVERGPLPPDASGSGQYGGVIDLLPGRISSQITRIKIATLKAKNAVP
jgi:dCTP deaminase